MQNRAGITTTSCCAHIIQTQIQINTNFMGSLLCVSVDVSIFDNV